ncbi:hypothetical protein AA0472_1651 [Acetobacter estunensis NRIC 0472]|uniref:Mannosyltransferase n=1 Tax=Acetobacter estunensis TaxID=104097 RepID=A0A967EBM8_9PROT|nr:capsular polysaccharide synthesis protein [Acetobacter estunensis]NHO53648.1 hypothetical protein [Acetobacter estunensis]GBQ25116.1 hypothetical protein AA0472_1651 [Acetobacter estunensis NRIC 0472]
MVVDTAETEATYLTLPMEKTSDFTLEDFAHDHQAMNYYHKHGAATVEHAFALANILHMHKLVREAAYFYGLAFNLHSKHPREYPLASSLLQARLLCMLKAGLTPPDDELEQLERLSKPIHDYICGIMVAWRQHDPKGGLERMGNCFEAFHTGEEVDVLYLETALSVLPEPKMPARPPEEQTIPPSIYMYWDSNRPEEVEQNLAYHREELEAFDVRMFDRDDAAQWLYERYGREAQDLFLNARHPAEAADFLRVHVIQELGGWWLDADIRITAPEELEALAVKKPSHVFFVTDNYYVHNDFFGSRRNSPILADCMLSLYRNSYLFKDLYIAYKTGPGVFNRALNRKLHTAFSTGQPFERSVMVLRSPEFDSIIADMDMAYKKDGNWHAAG